MSLTQIKARVCCALKGSLLGSSPRDAQRAPGERSCCRFVVLFAIRRGLHTGAVLFDAHQPVGAIVIQNAVNAEA
jgi:hypothetical protein